MGAPADAALPCEADDPPVPAPVAALAAPTSLAPAALPAAASEAELAAPARPDACMAVLAEGWNEASEDWCYVL